jgi:hypothetical protein
MDPLSAARVQTGERIVGLARYGYVVAGVDHRGLGAFHGVLEDACEITEWLGDGSG